MPFVCMAAELPNGHGPSGPPPNRLLDHVIRTPGRQPSPQPTHLSVPSSHRVLQETGSGYVAPKFEGKEKQIEEGKPGSIQRHSTGTMLTRHSDE